MNWQPVVNFVFHAASADDDDDANGVRFHLLLIFQTPLHCAASSTHGAMCLEILVGERADVNAKVCLSTSNSTYSTLIIDNWCYVVWRRSVCFYLDFNLCSQFIYS